jgi:hypothetical protein
VRKRAKSFGLEIVMVNVWEHVNARQEALHFCEVHKIQGPVLLDAKAEYITQLGLRGVPINIVVDKKGIVQAVGTTTPDEVRATLTRLLLPFSKK